MTTNPDSPAILRILAIDPGYERLGVAVVERVGRGEETLVYSDCLRTSAKDAFPDRLLQVARQVAELIERYEPSIFALEQLFFNTNQKTAMRVAEVRGACLYVALSKGLTVRQFTPSEIKSAITGSGNASKAAMMQMVPTLIRIEKAGALDDEFDAIATALTASAVSDHPSTGYPR